MGYKNVADGIDTLIELGNIQGLPGPTEERKAQMVHLEQLIEAVKARMQPEPRALATASTLQQLSVYIPADVTMADLVVGWRTLSHPAQPQEDPATTQRRATCGELAQLASQLTAEQGNREQAIRTWHAWSEAFKNRDDPRQTAMAKTFARELAELQDVAR